MIELDDRPMRSDASKMKLCCTTADLMRRETSCTTTLSVVSFSAECLTDKIVSEPEEVAPLVGKCPAVWIDVEGLHDRESIVRILSVAGVDESFVNLVFQSHERAFFKQFKSEILLVTPLLRFSGGLELQQLTIVQKGNTVITIHEHEIDRVKSIKQDVRNQHSLLDRNGRLYLLQRFVEAAVDSFQPILENYSKELECVEDEILAEGHWDTIWEIHRVRKELLVLKRLMLPLSDSLRQFSRDAEYYSDEGEKRVARDLFQHGTHMFDMIEYYINVTSELLNLHMSSVSNKMNQVMTVLAIVAAVFLPPSLVASIYGMNFYEHTSPWNMPELGWDLGYPFALVLMTGISLVFLIYFWQNGWLRVFLAGAGRRRKH